MLEYLSGTPRIFNSLSIHDHEVISYYYYHLVNGRVDQVYNHRIYPSPIIAIASSMRHDYPFLGSNGMVYNITGERGRRVGRIDEYLF